MKRILTLFLALALLLTVTGCGEVLEQAAPIVREVLEEAVQEAPEETAAEALPETECPTPETEAGTEAWTLPPSEETEAVTETATEAAPVETEEPLLDRDGSYYSKEEVALYIHQYGCLPGNYITKKQAEALGWTGGSIERYAPGKCIGGSSFGNYEGLLPAKKGRKYTECDIGTLGKSSRGAKRVVFSNDGLIYYTDDHYESFTLLYGEE